MPTQEISELLADELYEQAMLEAAETVGPNSYEYDDLVESIYERLCCA